MIKGVVSVRGHQNGVRGHFARFPPLFRPHHADDPRQNDAAWAVDFAGPRQGADGRCSTPGAEDPVNATQARGAHPLEPGPG